MAALPPLYSLKYCNYVKPYFGSFIILIRYTPKGYIQRLFYNFYYTRGNTVRELRHAWHLYRSDGLCCSLRSTCVRLCNHSISVGSILPPAVLTRRANSASI